MVQEGIDALDDVIYHIETYDIITIRASTLMFLTSRKIKSLGVKMVLSGEGANEIFGGYFYFHKAPTKEDFHIETCHKIKAFTCTTAYEQTKRPRLGVSKLEFLYWIRNSLTLPCLLIPSGRWYEF